MTFPIRDLKLGDLNQNDFFKQFILRGDSDKVLRSLSKINIFVGANNSGKSSLMRYLYQMCHAPFRFNPTIPEVHSLHDRVRIFCERILSIVPENDQDKQQKIRKIVKYSKNIPFMWSSESLSQILTRNYWFYENLAKNNIEPDAVAEPWIALPEQIQDRISKIALEIADQPLFEVVEDLKYIFTQIYIPTLRGLRPLAGSEEDHYLSTTIRDYFPDTGRSGVFTGQGINESVKKQLLGNFQERTTISNFQRFLSKYFFDDQTVLLLPQLDSNILKVKIGNEKERPIHELGDGVQHIIILTYQLFLHQGKNLLVFMEEPELFLHPGLQRTLLETLLQHKAFEGFQFFMTTHSNHFLDLTLDIDNQNISIYTFNKLPSETGVEEHEPTFEIENVNNEKLRTLELLGVKNSSIFLANCTIWIEGIMDRLYLRHYLKLYQEQLPPEAPRFREDYHYSFVEYGGGNVTHFSFLEPDDQDTTESTINVERLCSRLILIADQDDPNRKGIRHSLLRKNLGDRFVLLEAREIENLLSEHVLTAVVKEYEGGNPDIHTPFSQSEYRTIYLGKYIENKLLTKKRRGSYKERSGTLRDKKNFCYKAIKHMTSYDVLSEDAKA